MLSSLRNFPIFLSTLPLTLTPLFAATMPKKFFSSTPSSTTQTQTPQPASSSTPSVFQDGLELPKVFVFDLDYTLWPFWCDTHCTPPLKAVQPGHRGSDGSITKMKDRYGEEFGFYTGVPSILYAAKQKGITMSVASRTHAPDVAEQLLRGLSVSAPKAEPGLEQQGESRKEKEGSKPVKAVEFFFAPQMYPGSKVSHFHKIQAATKRQGKEIAFADMIFFDDEARNRNVETELGATFVLVRDGVTKEEVDRGVWDWRKRRGIARGERQGRQHRDEDINGSDEMQA